MTRLTRRGQSGATMVYVTLIAMLCSIAIVGTLRLSSQTSQSVARQELRYRAEAAMDALLTTVRVQAKSGTLPALPAVPTAQSPDGFAVTATVTDNRASLTNSIKVDLAAVWQGQTWRRAEVIGLPTGSTSKSMPGGGAWFDGWSIPAWDSSFRRQPGPILGTTFDIGVGAQGNSTTYVPGVPNPYLIYTAWLTVPVSGTYTFYSDLDDDGRFLLAGRVMWNPSSFAGHGSIVYQANIDLTAGTSYPFRYEFGDFGGNGRVFLKWRKPGDAELTPIPMSNLTPTTLIRKSPLTWSIPVNPVATFLGQSDFNSCPPSEALSLQGLGLAPGDRIQIQEIGGVYASSGNPDMVGMVAVFSSNSTVTFGGAAGASRVPGSIAASDGIPFTSPPLGTPPGCFQVSTWSATATTSPNQWQTTVTIPAGAQFLFVCFPDDYNLDNDYGPSGIYNVTITKL